MCVCAEQVPQCLMDIIEMTAENTFVSTSTCIFNDLPALALVPNSFSTVQVYIWVTSTWGRVLQLNLVNVITTLTLAILEVCRSMQFFQIRCSPYTPVKLLHTHPTIPTRPRAICSKSFATQLRRQEGRDGKMRATHPSQASSIAALPFLFLFQQIATSIYSSVYMCLGKIVCIYVYILQYNVIHIQYMYICVFCVSSGVHRQGSQTEKWCVCKVSSIQWTKIYSILWQLLLQQAYRCMKHREIKLGKTALSTQLQTTIYYHIYIYTYTVHIQSYT